MTKKKTASKKNRIKAKRNVSKPREIGKIKNKNKSKGKIYKPSKNRKIKNKNKSKGNRLKSPKKIKRKKASRGLRGILWRKLKKMRKRRKQEVKRKKLFSKLKPKPYDRKKKERAKKLKYKFFIREPKIIVFPKFKKIEKVDFKYPLHEPFAYARIKWNNVEKKIVYNVIEPELDQREKLLTKRIGNYIIGMIDINLSKLKNKKNTIDYIQHGMERALVDLGIHLTKNSYEKIMYYIYRNFAGLNEIDSLLHDPYIEDIGCVGVDSNIYIVHKIFGSIETNIKFTNDQHLEDFVIKLAEKCGRYISYAQPLFDGSLPDGSRVQATLAKDVTTKGSSFSIRKFRKNPFSPTDLINLGTVSPEMMAYIWTLIENDANILICGGVSTGKTTLLNSLSMFIQPEKKIVSIEDTRELQLPHDNWIPGVTRPGFGVPDASGEKYGEVDLFQLLKESFRQNPDYVIVGEIRGKEAYVLFQGMSSGNPSMGTMHAGSVNDVIKRLETPPIELPGSLIESLDAVLVMANAKEKGSSARRVKEVNEIKKVNNKTGKAEIIKTFTWKPSKDIFKSDINSSDVLRKIALRKGILLRNLLKEIKERSEVIEWMRRYKIVQFDEFSAIINLYHKDKKTVMLWVEKDIEPYKTKSKKEVMRMFKD